MMVFTLTTLFTRSLSFPDYLTVITLYHIVNHRTIPRPYYIPSQSESKKDVEDLSET